MNTKWISTEEAKPNPKKFVLVHMAKTTNLDKDDRPGACYAVAKLTSSKGHFFFITQSEEIIEVSDIDFWAEIPRI
jgi:hypothetical protein